MHPAQSPESNVSCQSCASYQLFLSAPSLFVVLPHSSPSPVFLACTSSPRTVYFVFKSSVLFSPCQVLRCVPVSLLICCPDVPSCLSAPCVAVILIKKTSSIAFSCLMHLGPSSLPQHDSMRIQPGQRPLHETVCLIICTCEITGHFYQGGGISSSTYQVGCLPKPNQAMITVLRLHTTENRTSGNVKGELQSI